MRGSVFKLAAAAVTTLASCVGALAQSQNPACQRLEAQLASLDRGNNDPARADQIRRAEDAVNRQQFEVDRLVAQSRRSGCESSGFFSIFSNASPHCGDALLKIEKKPELSQPLRRDCATSRSTSNCWRLTASSARRIWSARAGSLLPRSSDASWASSRWQAGFCDCASAPTHDASVVTATAASLKTLPLMPGTLTLKSWRCEPRA